MKTTVIRELKKIGITHDFIVKLAQGKADPEAYEPAGRLLSKVIAKVWGVEVESEQDPKPRG